MGREEHAARYFEQVAPQWDKLRSLYVSESAVEAALERLTREVAALRIALLVALVLAAVAAAAAGPRRLRRMSICRWRAASTVAWRAWAD